jgi:hypothetical protein
MVDEDVDNEEKFPSVCLCITNKKIVSLLVVELLLALGGGRAGWTDDRRMKHRYFA